MPAYFSNCLNIQEVCILHIEKIYKYNLNVYVEIGKRDVLIPNILHTIS